jgi:hypothetical protein
VNVPLGVQLLPEHVPEVTECDRGPDQVQVTVPPRAMVTDVGENAMPGPTPTLALVFDCAGRLRTSAGADTRQPERLDIVRRMPRLS